MESPHRRGGDRPRLLTAKRRNKTRPAPAHYPREREGSGKENALEVTVLDGCISCGLCTEEYPDLFTLNEEGLAEPTAPAVPPGKEGEARQAAEDCPVSVIQIHE